VRGPVASAAGSVVLVAALLFLALAAAGGGGGGQMTIGCKTGGAQLLSRSDQRGLYITLWCVKDGRVVP
jgi:hypothetical protein